MSCDNNQSNSLPLYYPFERVYKGDTLQRTISLTDSKTKLPIDLTDATIKMQIKVSDTGAAIKTLDNAGNGITVVDGFIIIQSDIDIAAGEYMYDLEVTKDSIKTTYIYGIFIVVSDITT